MKKIIALSLALLTLVTLLAGCKKTGKGDPTTTTGSQGGIVTPNGDNYTYTAVNETVYASTTVNIRSSASVANDGNIVGKLTAGDSIIRVGYNETWSKVDHNGSVCYISTKYLTTTKPAATTTSAPVDATQFTACDETVYVRPTNNDGTYEKGGNSNLRATASFNDGATTAVADGIALHRVGVYLEADGVNGWSKVEYNSKTYYIRNSQISLTDHTKATETTAAKAN